MRREKRTFRLWILSVAVLGIIAYLVVNLISTQVKISTRKQEHAAVQAELEAQIAKNEEIKRELDGSDTEITERAARDELDYARPNERVFVDVSGK